MNPPSSLPRPPGLPSRDARTPESIKGAKFLTETVDEHLAKLAQDKPFPSDITMSPCPFCGYVPYLIRTIHGDVAFVHDPGDKKWPKPCFMGKVVKNFSGFEAALVAWETRVPPASK